MYISRLQIEEGFLAGLDLRFSEGLNVIIGPRGAGKTSIIELIRYALNVRGITERAGAVGVAHARSVLDGGKVTVTLRDGDFEVIATRDATEDAPRLTGGIVAPTILSQNEIESIGVNAQSRLRLLDAFRSDNLKISLNIERARAEIREATINVREASTRVEQVEEQIGALESELLLLRGRKQEFQEQVERIAAASDKQLALETLSKASSQLSVEGGVLDRSDHNLNLWLTTLEGALNSAPRLEQWPTSAGDTDKLQAAREIVSQVRAGIESAARDLTRAVVEIRATKDAATASRVTVEEQLRELRQELDVLHAGSGALARILAEIEEKAGELTALSELLRQLQDQRAALIQARDAKLDYLEQILDTVFEERDLTASRLTALLGRKVEVLVQKRGMTSAYRDVLTAILRGSGLRQSDLVPLVVSRISPRELVSLIEDRSISELARILGIPVDRAARLSAVITGSGIEDLISCELDDSVALRLLDGADYKDSENLSTGQRCTTVLPLLLSRPDGVLIIDQPEDHLDNAFVVDVAVNVLRERRSGSQFILSTHNPNIPVIGHADLVVLMGSDGRNGFVRSAAALDTAESVKAITSVMEGGADAFQRRADFYRRGRE